MPFGLFEGKPPQLNVTLDKPTGPYYPGDVIHLTITVTAEKDTKVREVRASLLRRQRTQNYYQTEDTTTHEKKIDTQWQDQEVTVEKQVPAGETTLRGTQTYNVDLHIPPDAAPVYQGAIIENHWLVKVTADRSMASDADQEIMLSLITVPGGQHGGAGQYGSSTIASDTGMRFDLPKLDWANGENLVGTLYVEPHKDFEAREVRLVLLCHEEVTSPVQANTNDVTANQQTLAGTTQFHSGQTAQFAFTIPISNGGRPTISLGPATTHWTLKATIDRAWAGDPEVLQEIYVYSGTRQ